MRVVAGALERYRADRGAYPKSLDALVPSYLPATPPCRGGVMRAMFYYSDRGRFGLTCYTVVFAKRSYDSETRRFQTWD